MSERKEGGGEGHHHHHHRHKLYRRIFACIIGFIVLVLFVILVIWLVLRPTKPLFFLQDASVLAFNLTGEPPASYLTTTMQVTISTRNPNDHIGIYYSRLDVYAAYKYQQVTLATGIPRTYQGHNDVVVWSPFLYGINVPVAPYLAMGMGQDQNAGVMLLYVKMAGRLRWKVGLWTSGHYHISVSCPALLSFDGRGGGGGYSPVIRFQQVSTCTVDV